MRGGGDDRRGLPPEGEAGELRVSDRNFLTIIGFSVSDNERYKKVADADRAPGQLSDVLKKKCLYVGSVANLSTHGYGAMQALKRPGNRGSFSGWISKDADCCSGF